MSGPRICIPKRLPVDHHVGAALRAVAHNPDNAPEILHDDNLAHLHPLEIASVTSKRWKPGTTITVGFLGGSVQTRARVLKALRRWSEVCNILFAPADVSTAICRIAFDPRSGSWSYIGTDILSILYPQPTMNLGWIDDDTPDEEVHRVVVHEGGHTLSFEHEFQLGLATREVEPNVPAILDFYTGPPNSWSAAEVWAQVLNKLDLQGVDHSAWDKRSIMEYWMEPNWLIPPTEIPQTTDLSPTDIAKAAEWYPPSPAAYPAAHPTAPDFGVAAPGGDPLLPVWVGNFRLVNAVNAARAALGLSALTFDGALGAVAGLQARRCAQQGRMTHLRPGFATVAQEYRQYGRDVLMTVPTPGQVVAAGECIFVALPWPAGLAPDAARVVAAWMGDPPHRAVLVATRPRLCGFGWAYGQGGALYVVGGFGNPA